MKKINIKKTITKNYPLVTPLIASTALEVQ